MDVGHIAGRLTPTGRLSQPSLPGIATAGGGFEAGAAGSKRYGTGQVMPTQGKIPDLSGYMQRDQRVKARQQALAQRAGLAKPALEGR